MKMRYVIGIVGGIASGKSFVANVLKKEQNATIIDVDKIAHEFLHTTEVMTKLQKRWKNYDLKLYSSRIEDFRKAIADIIFNDEKELKFFNKIMKRLINKKVISIIKSTKGLIVLDMPLLFESKMQKWCDSIWYISLPRKQRITNFAKRYKDTDKTISKIIQDYNARETQQISCEEKEKRANQIIVNDMDNDLFEKRIKETYNQDGARNKLRLCKDCKWCKKESSLYTCLAPQNFDIETNFSTVTGKTEETKEARYVTCETHRGGYYTHNKSCNASGDWFEVKE